jgi:hypothetical protein
MKPITLRSWSVPVVRTLSYVELRKRHQARQRARFLAACAGFVFLTCVGTWVAVGAYVGSWP